MHAMVALATPTLVVAAFTAKLLPVTQHAHTIFCNCTGAWDADAYVAQIMSRLRVDHIHAQPVDRLSGGTQFTHTSFLSLYLMLSHDAHCFRVKLFAYAIPHVVQEQQCECRVAIIAAHLLQRLVLGCTSITIARTITTISMVLCPACDVSSITGERKRVALAAALIQKPDLLILDEPTNHLDVEAIEWLEDLLTDKHLTCLLVTHDRW
jgi:ABC transporter